MRKIRWAAVTGLLMIVAIRGSAAATCQNNGSFSDWLGGVKQEALSQAVTPETVRAALDGITFNPAIVALDRRQGVFQQSFLQFSDRMVNSNRLDKGARLIQKHGTLFERIEREYGVPAPVLVALWGLESDFGLSGAKFQTLRALATLAYDCRRPSEFRPQLLDALRVIDRGDLKPSEMVGEWAGELGPMRFPPSDYYEFAVDYDGDGRRDLINSVPDMLASTAALFANWGWRRGEPWLQEVRVPLDLPWDQADLSIQLPRSQWAQWGVRLVDNGRLPADDLPASLLLPMGYRGPTFLAYHNFRAYLRWNQAMVYSTTAAYLSTRLAGAPPVRRGSGAVVPLNSRQIMTLQQLLVKQGYLSGEVDGKLGRATRASVRSAQLALGFPADSYPTLELFDQLQAKERPTLKPNIDGR